MTQRQQAKELVELFMSEQSAKECAIICAEQIKKAMAEEMPHPGFQKYWNEIITEITYLEEYGE